MNFFTDNIMIVMFLPLWICLIILSGIFLRIVGNNKITFLLTILSSVIGLIFAICSLNAITIPQQIVTEHSFELFSAGGVHICAGALLNTDTCIFLIVLMIISLIAQIYLYTYFQNKKTFNLYFFFLNILNFALTGLVLSPNLVQFFVFQTMAVFTIYVLSSFYKTNSEENPPILYLIINTIADAALLAGIILFSYISLKYMELLPHEFLAFNAFDKLKENMDFFLYPEVNSGIIILFIIYALIKMLIFPFHQGLCSINKNISPLSVYVNSLFITFSGIFILIKLYPFIPETILSFIGNAGLLTALILAFILVAQKDIRKILSYIIAVQTGLITVLIGFGAINLAVIASVIFVFTSVLMTLCLNEIIDITKETNKDKICGIKNINYPLSIYWLISAISVSGICFGGFTQKDLIIKTLRISENNFSFILIIIIYFLLTYVCFRLYLDIFKGENKQYKYNDSKYKTFCFMVLSLFVVLPGFMFNISNTNIFIADLLISLISVLAIAIVYVNKIGGKNLFPVFMNNIAEKELYIPSVFDFILKIARKIFEIINYIDKYAVDKILKYVFIPFRKAFNIKNDRFQKVWLILYIIIILCITFCLYNCTGGTD